MTSSTIPLEDLSIGDTNAALSIYRFDEDIAKNYFCKRYGIFTFVETRLNPREFRVNLGCVEGIDSFTIPVAVFDGKNI